uniref:Clathrin light chain n=1 Tax=Rhinolophus ferrumequinum TaxID=59479 RepID=A0A671F134_RHIFE
MADDFGFFSSSLSGAPEAAEEDPAAAFLAQQESEIAGIENDEGFGAPAGGQAVLAQPGPANGAGSEDIGTTINGDVFQPVGHRVQVWTGSPTRPKDKPVHTYSSFIWHCQGQGQEAPAALIPPAQISTFPH